MAASQQNHVRSFATHGMSSIEESIRRSAALLASMESQKKLMGPQHDAVAPLAESLRMHDAARYRSIEAAARLAADSVAALQLKISLARNSNVQPRGALWNAVQGISILQQNLGLIATGDSRAQLAIRNIAESARLSRAVIDTELLRQIQESNAATNRFSERLAAQLQAIALISPVTIADPTADDIDAIELETIDLVRTEPRSFVTAARLPLDVLSRILRNPSEVRSISPRQFEEFIADLLSRLGFEDVQLTPRSRDGGKDIVASHTVAGIPLIIYFECKQYANKNKVGLETMRSLLGTVASDSHQANKGVLVTTSTFTRGAKEFMMANARVDGKDYDGLLGWVAKVARGV